MNTKARISTQEQYLHIVTNRQWLLQVFPTSYEEKMITKDILYLSS